MADPIEITRLSKVFGLNLAVARLSLTVPKGAFMGFFGPNGSGKTTTIKTMLNIIPPTSGEARILGVRSKSLGPEQFQRIGYVSENQYLPLWMSMRDLIDYCRPMYPTWDDVLCERLYSLFDLPSGGRLKSFSRGMLMKAALLSSLSYRPELVVLDEPFSGLDPLSRDQFIEGLLELSGESPFTLFISSHDVDEVERLCDAITFIDAGRAILTESTESLLHRFRRVEVSIPNEQAVERSRLPESWRSVRQEGGRLQFMETAFESDADESERVGGILEGGMVRSIQMVTLREIVVFLSDVGGGKR